MSSTSQTNPSQGPSGTRSWPEQLTPIPQDASAEYRDILEKHDALIDAFMRHPALPPQHPLGRPLPGSKIFYMFDFVCRTRLMAQELDPKNPSKKRDTWMDIQGRAMFTNLLINDTSGKLSMMTQEKPGEEVDFGDEIREKAAILGGKQ